MNQKSITDLFGTVADLLDNDNSPKTSTNKKTQKEKSKTGFALLQPMMQNYVNDSSNHANGTKVEDLDNDHMMDILSGMSQGLNLTSLLKNFDMNQVGDIIAFVQETFNGSSNAKQEEHASGFASILEGVQGMNLDAEDITNALGGLMNLLKK